MHVPQVCIWRLDKKNSVNSVEINQLLLFGLCNRICSANFKPNMKPTLNPHPLGHFDFLNSSKYHAVQHPIILYLMAHALYFQQNLDSKLSIEKWWLGSTANSYFGWIRVDRVNKKKHKHLRPWRKEGMLGPDISDESICLRTKLGVQFQMSKDRQRN